MKIVDISLFQLRGRWAELPFAGGERQVRALDIYPEFNRPVAAGDYPDGQPVRATYVEIGTDAGIAGLFGPIFESQAYLIHTALRPTLLGRDPLATETLWDQMGRLDRHGRSGLFMTAVSSEFGSS